MGVVALATYSHVCEGRSPSLKTLIRCWNLLQDLSTLYLQSAFFIEKSVKKEKRIKRRIEEKIESVS